MEVAASVVGLLAAGAQVCSILHQFTSSCVNAPELARTVHHEIRDFTFILSKLQPIVLGTALLNLSRASLVDIDHLEFTLTGCVYTLSELEKGVNRLSIHRKMDVLDRIKWSRIETTLTQLIQRLQNHKLSLNLILTILTRCVLEICLPCPVWGLTTVLSWANLSCFAALLSSESYTEATDSRNSLDELLFRRIPSAPNPGESMVLGSTPTVTVENPNSDLATDDSSLVIGSSRDSIRSRSIMGDESSVLGDDSGSIMTVTRSRRAGLYRLAFESTLFISRPYRRTPNDSSISLASSKRPKPSWSLFSGGTNTSVLSLPTSMHEVSGVSLAKASDISVLSLPIYAEELYNPRWYEVNTSGASTLSPALPPGQVGTSIASQRGAPLSLWGPRGKGKSLQQLLLACSKDKDKNILLHEAAENGEMELVEFLLDQGAEMGVINKDRSTVLHKAVEGGQQAIVMFLLDRGAKMEAKNSYGYTPLHQAARYGKEVLVNLLLDRGAEIEVKSANRNTPLHQAAGGGNEVVVKLLLDRGAGMEVRDINGNTPLHQAVESGKEAVVKLLLDRGAEMEAKDQYWHTPLHRAAGGGEEVVVKLLLDRGVEMEVKDIDGNTPLHRAAGGGKEAVVKLLLDRGAEMEAKDQYGHTPLHRAAGGGEEVVVKLLLDRGAYMEAKNRWQRTPLYLAQRSMEETVVKLLLNRGAEDII